MLTMLQARIVISLFFVLCLQNICFSQSVDTTYFKDYYLKKEVKKEKAKFIKIVIVNNNGTVTTEKRYIHNMALSCSETYKGEEPFGTWTISTGSGFKELDYNFELNYADTACNGKMKEKLFFDFFKDNDSLEYVAPKFAGRDTGIIQFIGRNIWYPDKAIENYISGTVYVRFLVTKEGNIERIAIKRGKDPLIDKEGMRVIRELKFLNPPMSKGKPFAICITIPIRFALK